MKDEEKEKLAAQIQKVKLKGVDFLVITVLGAVGDMLNEFAEYVKFNLDIDTPVIFVNREIQLDAHKLNLKDGDTTLLKTKPEDLADTVIQARTLQDAMEAEGRDVHIYVALDGNTLRDLDEEKMQLLGWMDGLSKGDHDENL